MSPTPPTSQAQLIGAETPSPAAPKPASVDGAVQNSPVDAAPKPVRPRISSIAVLRGALASAMRFYWNKLRYGGFLHAPAAARGEHSDNGPILLVHASAGDASATLPFCLGRDPRGILCAVQPAWLYLHDFAGKGEQKVAIIRRLLAKLPGHVTLHFAFQTYLPDADLVRRAFSRSGFTILEWGTFIYTPPQAHGDLIDTFSGRSIKGTLRRARRDLEIVEISASEYIDFQRDSLAASGKKNTRNDRLDKLIVDEAVRRKCARILAARRKPTDANAAAGPLEAAVVLLWDEADRNMVLWRLFYREHAAGPYKPHVDASKLLVLAAMENAAARGFTLDTDGFTSGMTKLYTLFGPGVFQLVDRIHCERECLWATLIRYYPSMGRQPWLRRGPASRIAQKQA